VTTAAALYADGLRGAPLRMRRADGASLPVDLARWLGAVDAADETVLARVTGPALDVGCGPGRHVRELARRGVLALGVDVSPDAARLALARGAPVLCASVFGPVPGAGTWRTALLLDDNLGIGGEPVRLLRCVRELLAPDGRVLVEAMAPGTPTRVERVRLEADGVVSPAFRWATVGTDALPALAREAGLTVVERWSAQGRWFAELR
jgi:SAM-dependent methyltransferase